MVAARRLRDEDQPDGLRRSSTRPTSAAARNEGYGIAVDGGNAYVTGDTGRPTSRRPSGPSTRPTTAAADSLRNEAQLSGAALVYSTYLGGSGTEFGFGIALDGSGGTYLTGVAGAGNNSDAFVTKLDLGGPPPPPPPPPPGDGHIYWTNGRMIGRAEGLDGQNPNGSFIALPGTFGATGVAVDSGHVYWADSNADTIGGADLDGPNVDPSFIAVPHYPVEVAVGFPVISTGPTPAAPSAAPTLMDRMSTQPSSPSSAGSPSG